jgi:hypothetical protein
MTAVPYDENWDVASRHGRKGFGVLRPVREAKRREEAVGRYGPSVIHTEC